MKIQMLCEPETYGLSGAETLAHTADPRRPENFDSFWKRFGEEAASLSPTFEGSSSDPVNTVVFRSMRAVRVVGCLSLPERSPAGIVIALHGYGCPSETFDDDDAPWLTRNLAVLRLRVRGFPPSVQDTGDLRGDWILHQLESPDAWIVRGAVADVVHAARCMDRRFGPNVPISLYGESLGGGLAIIAAAQLRDLDVQIHRMVVGLPSLGDWRWRHGRYCNGAGGQINLILDTYRNQADIIIEQLRLFDAALHARRVDCPVLCKLALGDDVVPAPSAAAVCNALASSDKWKYLVKYGHYDGGIADARRHAIFERIHPAFLDPSVRPDDALKDFDLEGGLTASAAAGGG